MKTFENRAMRAVTLTELLVVLAIISLLATIAVPVFVQKTHQARIATARMEVREIAMAQDMCAMTHGYYVPIHILDNVPNLNVGSTGTAHDNFADYPTASTTYVVNPFLDLAEQVSAGQDDLAVGTADPNDRVAQMINYWQGPFLNAKRVYTGNDIVNDPQDLTQQEVSYDFVLDPWGRPYRFYSPIGIISTASESTINATPSNNDIDDGNINQNQDDRFDRFAIVSFGSNGESDSSTVQEFDDDIFYEFGPVANETAFNSIF
ncbi:type II secretion system GspH family protein [bacterium]|nr:type II secretion system GspH family protein [bacterium]